MPNFKYCRDPSITDRAVFIVEVAEDRILNIAFEDGLDKSLKEVVAEVMNLSAEDVRLVEDVGLTKTYR